MVGFEFYINCMCSGGHIVRKNLKCLKVNFFNKRGFHYKDCISNTYIYISQGLGTRCNNRIDKEVL